MLLTIATLPEPKGKTLEQMEEDRVEPVPAKVRDTSRAWLTELPEPARGSSAATSLRRRSGAAVRDRRAVNLMTYTVVVGVDGSAHGDAALRWALAEAEAHDEGRVTAVFCVAAPVRGLSRRVRQG